MSDVFLIANDPLLLRRMGPFVDKMKSEGLSVMTAESETRASGGGAEEIVRDLILIVTPVVLTKEYERIKGWLKDWFVELPPPKDVRRELYVRFEDENRHLIERVRLSED